MTHTQDKIQQLEARLQDLREKAAIVKMIMSLRMDLLTQGKPTPDSQWEMENYVHIIGIEEEQVRQSLEYLSYPHPQ